MPYVKNADLLKGSKEWIYFKRLAKNNTLAVTHKHKTLAIRYYWTDIITYSIKRKTITLNSGEWLTPSTKDRINHYLINSQFPGINNCSTYITQTDSRWFVENGISISLFYDGVVLDDEGYVINPMYEDKKRDRLLKQIEKYINKLSHAIRNRHLLDAQLLNTSGDCFCCMMGDTITGKPLGDITRNNDHLLSHIKEGYIMGSLIYNALIYSGYKQKQLPYLSANFWNFKHTIIRSVRRYLKGEILGINRK